jgi:hypothetical protein
MTMMRQIRAGRSAGYPLCCVLFFALIFSPLWRIAEWARGKPSSPALGCRERLRASLYWFLFDVWCAPHACVQCPLHRVASARGRA